MNNIYYHDYKNFIVDLYIFSTFFSTCINLTKVDASQNCITDATSLG